MNEIAVALFAILALLLPVAIYCFVLAAINRRSRPLLVSGGWDAIGLAFAMSGFFVATVPSLASEFIRRVLGAPDLGMNGWLWWLIYYLVVIGIAVALVLARSKKTVIYNVDPELFTRCAEQSFTSIGLAMRVDGKRVFLTPGEAASDPSTAVTERRTLAAATDRRYAELTIENFASMCNVTLHWGACTPDLRAELERELDKNLESAAPLDNSAAGWFVSVSGMIFGAVLVILSMFIFMLVLRRWD